MPIGEDVKLSKFNKRHLLTHKENVLTVGGKEVYRGMSYHDCEKEYYKYLKLTKYEPPYEELRSEYWHQTIMWTIAGEEFVNRVWQKRQRGVQRMDIHDIPSKARQRKP